MSDRISVYSTDKAFEAEMLIAHLASNGIVAFTLDQKDSAYHFGSIEILVKNDDVIASKKLIEEYFSNE